MHCHRGLLLGVALAAVSFVASRPERPLVVLGGSMAPTYADRSLLWTVPLDRPLQRGDVVVADLPTGPVIKRVALLAGDRRLQWQGGGTWTDMTTLCGPRGAAGRRRMRAAAVPEGTVYLLGDNLDRSVDSRTYGPVPVARIRRRILDVRTPDSLSGVAREVARSWLAFATEGGMDLLRAPEAPALPPTPPR